MPICKRRMGAMPEPYAMVLFDGECAFCDGSVKWMIEHDHAGRFRFTARQSPAGQRLLTDPVVSSVICRRKPGTATGTDNPCSS